MLTTEEARKRMRDVEREMLDRMKTERECPECDGSGYYFDYVFHDGRTKCPYCRGTGKVRDE